MGLLGVVIISFGFRIYTQRETMKRHFPEIFGATILSSLFSLFSTAFAAKAIGLPAGEGGSCGELGPVRVCRSSLTPACLVGYYWLLCSWLLEQRRCCNVKQYCVGRYFCACRLGACWQPGSGATAFNRAGASVIAQSTAPVLPAPLPCVLAVNDNALLAAPFSALQPWHAPLYPAA